MNHLPELIELCRHPAIQSRRGRWLPGDIHIDKYGLAHHVTPVDLYGDEDGELAFENNTWLPPLSDPIQPERGLMSMAKGGWPLLLWNGDEWCFKASSKGIFYTGHTPEIAVAKAIIAKGKESRE